MTTDFENTPQGGIPSNSTCRSNRTDGSRCKAPPTSESDLCFWHDPDRREEMLVACRRGGSRRTIPLPTEVPLSSEEARGILASVLVGLLQGSIDPTTAKAAGYLIQIERKVAEGQELEKRIEVLEEILNQRKEA